MADHFSTDTPPVVIRNGALGDMIMILPMLRWLAEHCGAPPDVISSGAWTKTLLGMQPWVGDLLLLTSRRSPYWLNRSQQRAVSWLRRQGPRPTLVCEASSKSHDLALRGNIRENALYRWQPGSFLPGEHGLERWLRVAHQCYGLTYDPSTTRDFLRGGWVYLDAEHERDCNQWLQQRGWANRKLVLIQPGCKRTMKHGSARQSSNRKYWPDEHWSQLCRQILDSDSDTQVLICGSPKEYDYTHALAVGIGSDHVVSVANELPIPRLLALQKRAHSMVSVDTGPAHSAAAMNCPLVVLFGHEDPQLWQPYQVDAPVTVVRSPTGEHLSDIPLSKVLEACSRL